jgi:hypothetical protein
MPHQLSRPAPIEIKIANVGLVPKLDAIGAALCAIKEAHRDELSARAWFSIGEAESKIADAILHAEKNPEGSSSCLLKYSNFERGPAHAKLLGL